MLILGSRFENESIVSFQTANEVARTTRAIIDPRNLRILGYEVSGPLIEFSPSVLLIGDIREIGELGMIIDDIDEIVEPKDIIKFNEVYEYEFEIKNILVIDQRKKKIGRVLDYTIDSDTFIVQQLSVRRPLLKSFNDSELLIHRSQIVAIDNEKITISSEDEKPKEPVRQNFRPNYNNPFRTQTDAAPEAIDQP